MVEGDNDIMEGQMDIVAPARHRRLPRFERPTELIAERADGPALKRRQSGAVLERVQRQTPAQRFGRRRGFRLAVPVGRAVADREDAERIGGEGREPSQRRMRHRAVEQTERPEPGKAWRRLDGVDPCQFPNPHQGPTDLPHAACRT